MCHLYVTSCQGGASHPDGAGNNAVVLAASAETAAIQEGTSERDIDPVRLCETGACRLITQSWQRPGIQGRQWSRLAVDSLDTLWSQNISIQPKRTTDNDRAPSGKRQVIDAVHKQLQLWSENQRVRGSIPC
jgi:hypothetical protein